MDELHKYSGVLIHAPVEQSPAALRQQKENTNQYMETMNIATTKERAHISESTKEYWEYADKNFLYELDCGRNIFYSRVDEFGWKQFDCDQTVDARVLTAVIRRLQEIWSLEKKTWAFLNCKVKPSPGEWDMYDRASDKAYASLNRILARYTATPRVSTVFEIEWIQHGSKSPKIAELRSILEIIKVAQDGRISDLKQCDQCGEWLIAVFPEQRFCPGDECREKFHASNMAESSNGTSGQRRSAINNG
jgi:hypothetical protein